MTNHIIIRLFVSGTLMSLILRRSTWTASGHRLSSFVLTSGLSITFTVPTLTLMPFSARHFSTTSHQSSRLRMSLTTFTHTRESSSVFLITPTVLSEQSSLDRIQLSASSLKTICATCLTRIVSIERTVLAIFSATLTSLMLTKFRLSTSLLRSFLESCLTFRRVLIQKFAMALFCWTFANFSQALFHKR